MGRHRGLVRLATALLGRTGACQHQEAQAQEHRWSKEGAFRAGRLQHGNLLEGSGAAAWAAGRPRKLYRWGALLLLASSAASRAEAQSNVQAWYDVEFDYVITPKLLVNVEVGPKVLMSSDLPGWNAFDLTPGLEYSVEPWADLLLYAPLSATVQKEGVNTFEVRWTAGTRLAMRPSPRLLLRTRALFEYRSISFLGADSSQVSTRSRVRVEARYAINSPNYSAPGTLYGLTDFEGFLNFGKAPSERFLNRIRFRLGAGYRFSHWWTAEAIYSLQGSDNTLGADDIPTQDHIVRLRLVHFLN